MNNLTKVSVSSRRSLKFRDEYLTAEMTIEANVEGMNEEVRSKQVQEMWDFANGEVDKNLQDSVKSLTTN
jgi:hypothetical protein